MQNKRYVNSGGAPIGAAGAGGPKDFYGFYARLKPEVSQLVTKAHEEAKEKYGAPLSHPLLLEELLKTYLTQIKGGVVSAAESK
jgi:hypothetical protein